MVFRDTRDGRNRPFGNTATALNAVVVREVAGSNPVSHPWRPSGGGDEAVGLDHPLDALDRCGLDTELFAESGKAATGTGQCACSGRGSDMERGYASRFPVAAKSIVVREVAGSNPVSHPCRQAGAGTGAGLSWRTLRR